VTETRASIQQLIERHRLEPHPEGGWYRETFRAEKTIPDTALPPEYDGDRAAMTSILFLLPRGSRSAWHRIRSEELWIHIDGDDLELRVTRTPVRPDAEAAERVVRIGRGDRAELQAAVPGGWWQTAAPRDGRHGYALVACVVAPGFEFADFELAD